MAQYLYITDYINNQTMKNSTKTTVLLKAFDIELRAILVKDLKAFKAAQQHKNNVAFLRQIAA
jgi:hypothetical protein